MTGAQLNDSASTGVLFGQKDQKHAKQAYKDAAMLIGRPALPSDHRAFGSASGSRNLFSTMHVIAMA